jgi:hypothetical protein
MFQPTRQQELVHNKHRREEYARGKSDMCLRHSLSTMMMRWDSISKELASVTEKGHLAEHRKGHNKNVEGYYARSQSTPQLLQQSPPEKRWQSCVTAKNGAPADRPPTLKREKSFGSSSLVNASFPLRSRDGKLEPLALFQAAEAPSPRRVPVVQLPPALMVIKKHKGDDCAASSFCPTGKPRTDLMSLLAQGRDKHSGDNHSMQFALLPESCIHQAPPHVNRTISRQVSTSSSSLSSSHGNSVSNILSSAIALLSNEEI